MNFLLLMKGIIGAVILLLPVYYIVRKIIAAAAKKEYKAKIDIWIDEIIMRLLAKLAKKQKSELSNKVNYVVVLLRLIIMWGVYFQLIRLIPVIL